MPRSRYLWDRGIPQYCLHTGGAVILIRGYCSLLSNPGAVLPVYAEVPASDGAEGVGSMSIVTFGLIKKHYNEHSFSHGNPVKTKYDEDQGSALICQMKKPLSFAPPLICGWPQTHSGFFVGPLVNGSAKQKGLKRTVRPIARFSHSGVRSKGSNPFLWRPG